MSRSAPRGRGSSSPLSSSTVASLDSRTHPCSSRRALNQGIVAARVLGPRRGGQAEGREGEDDISLGSPRPSEARSPSPPDRYCPLTPSIYSPVGVAQTLRLPAVDHTDVTNSHRRERRMNIKTILVPLDGSNDRRGRADTSCGVYAGKSGAKLVLLRAAQAHTDDADPTRHKWRWCARPRSIWPLLARASWRAGAGEVETSVWYGPAADAIVEAARLPRRRPHRDVEPRPQRPRPPRARQRGRERATRDGDADPPDPRGRRAARCDGRGRPGGQGARPCLAASACSWRSTGPCPRRRCCASCSRSRARST